MEQFTPMTRFTTSSPLIGNHDNYWWNLSTLVRFPFSGVKLHAGTAVSLLEMCPHFRDVLRERFHYVMITSSFNSTQVC